MARRTYDSIALLAGVFFGLGLAISQMINPSKVLAFLDITGDWDPSLALVMGAAVAVTTLAFRVVLRRKRPMLDATFHLPTRVDIDTQLILGAAIFGTGWGLAGYCPGPAIAALTMATPEPLIFLAAMLVGSQAAKRLKS